MGDHINGGFYKEINGCFAAPKKSGRNNEVTVNYWGGRKAGFHCIVNFFQIQSTLAGYEELAVGFEPNKNGEIFVTMKGKTNRH